MSDIKNEKTIVISDVDGCLTDGNFIYTENGKVAKIYGPHDNDGVKLLKANDIDVVFISADHRGFNITKRRIEDMKCKLENVDEKSRLEYISKKCKEYDNVIFFGDGIADALVKERLYNDITFITPQNAREEAKELADFITESRGGQGAFLDLAIEVVKYFGKGKELY